MNKLEELRRISLGPTRSNTSLIIAAGSLLDYVGDAIVNAANEGGSGGFGVDEQVNRAGGFQLKEARKAFNGIPTGYAKVTPSFDHHKVKHIIHATGPVYRTKYGMTFDDQNTLSDYFTKKDPLLVSTYKASFDCAKELCIETLAFSLLSAGVFRGERSLEDILRIGLKSVVNNCYEGLREVTMVCWTKEEQDVMTKLVDEFAANPEAW